MLTMKAKYALKALVILAKNGDRLMPTKAVSAQAGVPNKFLEMIMTELRNNDIVRSRRGIAGGYMLARDPAQIRIGDIMRIVDGPLALIRCASLTAYQKCDDCPDEEICSLRGVMLDARAAVSSVLDQRTVQDMVNFETKGEEVPNEIQEVLS